MDAPITRSNTKAPITGSSSPQFTGNIAAGNRPKGPCRTGDAALIEFLLNKARLLTTDQIEAAKAKSQKEALPLDAACIGLGFFGEEQLVSVLTSECFVPHLKVDKYEIRKKALDTISKEDALYYGVMPVDKLGSLLTLAMVNPLDLETERVLESKTGLEIKKVVATRTEITQGIDKYYSGKVQAKDTSLSFSAEPSQEIKSVTQLLGKVKELGPNSAPPAAARPGPGTASIPPAMPDIAAEIQDIDDLLAADEVIAPAIIEPMKPTDGEPLIVPAGDIIEIAEAAIIEPGALELRKSVAPEFEAEPTMATPELALELEDAPLSPAIAPPARPATVQTARPAAPAPSTATQPRKPVVPTAKPATVQSVKPAAPARIKVINLIPILEDEFQHAITHGKAHVFEKWVGLQSRNRIINAVPVEAELQPFLSGVYSAPRKAG
jgi:hypothetical protein